MKIFPLRGEARVHLNNAILALSKNVNDKLLMEIIYVNVLHLYIYIQ